MTLQQYSIVGTTKTFLVKMKLFLLLSVMVVASCALYYRPDATVKIGPGVDNVRGNLELYKTAFGVLITGRIEGLTPGLHGFHVHESGDLSRMCAAAGGHFDPFQTRQHGAPYDLVRHGGDLGNILAGLDGVANVYIHDTIISLNRNDASYIGGLAVVVHQGVDDLGRGGNPDSLSTGNAGGRSGCGRIDVH